MGLETRRILQCVNFLLNKIKLALLVFGEHFYPEFLIYAQSMGYWTGRLIYKKLNTCIC